MADFLDSEAEESEEEEELDQNEKKKLKKIKAVEESDEEDEDDEEEVQDLIDDNPIEEESDAEDSDTSGGTKKRKKSDDEDFDDRLEEEDYDLIEENLGVKLERKRRFKRLRRIQDEESEDEQEKEPEEERDAIATELFEGSGDEREVFMEEERRSERSHRPEVETLDEEGSEGDDDMNDFIVDEDGRSLAEKRMKKKPIFSDAALQEAQDIFGVDFDFDEFGKFGEEDYEEEEEEEEEDEYLDDDVDERPRRPKKPFKKKSTRKSIFEIYEPSELKRGHFTDLDNEIRNTDIPERMQLRSVPFTPVAEGSDELDLEAEWIYKQAFCRPTISVQDAHLNEEAKERAKKGPQTIGKIKKALDFMCNQNFEVPFISFYRKEYVLPELNINDLWKVYKFDAKWCQLRQRKENLLKLFKKMRNYQLDEIMKNPDAPLPDNVRVIKDDDIERLKNIQTSEELNDVYQHFMLYYSHEIPIIFINTLILWIGNEEFEDLDEIIARHVNPMAAYASELLDFKYYKVNVEGVKDKAEDILKEQKKQNPGGIPYIISAAKNYPGKFLLSYLPRIRCRHEYVSVSPDGFKFRGQIFSRVNDLFRWFKEHFRDPIPGQSTPGTPHGALTSRTPYHATPGTVTGMNQDAIQRVAQNLPHHMLHSLSQVANQTPHHYPPHTPGAASTTAYGGMHTYPNTPYTPSGQTPFMTPYQTPHHTPHHAQQTPNHHQGPFLHPVSSSIPTVTQRSIRSHRPTPSMSTPSSGDAMDWSKAAEAWARLKQSTPRGSGSTPRYEESRKTPRNYEDSAGRTTPRNRTPSNRTPSYKSPRGTPFTNSSPRSMSLSGDGTPLYDES
ncbi:transcription elongation factor SPT6-like [Vespula pensylvanica]|uniref:transcription elongation factor SPT6-like n=1 Tax=Vespula pensylvanica TaxID=30213 RepID=UPI001CBA33C6|nr:transcription elongation factor SPT6-like [Vespula pensylvanica]